MTKLTIVLPPELMNGARRVAKRRETTLARLVRDSLERVVAREADSCEESVEEFCRRKVRLKSGRPRVS